MFFRDVFASEGRIWNWADLATYRKTYSLYFKLHNSTHKNTLFATIDTAALTNREIVAATNGLERLFYLGNSPLSYANSFSDISLDFAFQRNWTREKLLISSQIW